MILSTLNVRGGIHNSCEDSIYVKEDEISISGGIFDGCSTGEKSHWASQTLSYLFQQFKDPTDFESIYKVLMSLLRLRYELGINEMNMLSTCLLFHYNKLNKKLCFRALGDGNYYVNDVEYEIEQNNEPDYLAYLLRSFDIPKDFSKYMEKYPKQKYTDVNSFKICSDGIKSISISQFVDEPKHKDPLALLLHPPSTSNYLQRMWNILKREGYTISDDLSIISYVTDTD